MKSRLVIIKCAGYFSGSYFCGDYSSITDVLFSKCDVEAGLTVQSLSPFPSSYQTVLDKGRYPIYLLVNLSLSLIPSISHSFFFFLLLFLSLSCLLKNIRTGYLWLYLFLSNSLLVQTDVWAPSKSESNK